MPSLPDEVAARGSRRIGEELQHPHRDAPRPPARMAGPAGPPQIMIPPSSTTATPK
jgi:hypothetical protein